MVKNEWNFDNNTVCYCTSSNQSQTSLHHCRTIFIAEAANGGGRVLGFSNSDYEAGGDVEPSINNLLSGANSLYFHEED